MPKKPLENTSSGPPESDEQMFFSASPPTEAPKDKHYLTPNPEFDRPGSHRREGVGDGSPIFTIGLSGARKGYENAARVMALTGNALYEPDVERRLVALKEVLDFIETVEGDPNAAEVVSENKGLLLGAMGGTLMARRQGDASQNGREAIDYFQRAMQHFVTHNDEANILKTKYNLANAYSAGITSDDRSDGKLALSYLREVIVGTTPTSDGLLGLVARLNFGGLVVQFNQKGINLGIEEALGFVQEVASAVSRTENPSLWSAAMNTLGGLYAERQNGDRRSNLRQAIECFERCLEARPKNAVPTDWNITTQNLFGIKKLYAHEFGSEPERNESIRSEIEQQEQMIAEFTKQGRPILAAGEKLELAQNLIFSHGGTKNDLNRAKSLIDSAFETFSERNATSEMVQSLVMLHHADFRLGELPVAAFHGWLALALSEELEEGGAELERVREISQNLKGLDARVAILFLSIGETAAALDAMERGRARFLRSALRMRRAESEQEIAVGKARSRVIELERELEGMDDAPRNLVEAFLEAREELSALEQLLPQPLSPQNDENALRRTWHVAERLMQTYRAIVVPIFDDDQYAIIVLALKGTELRASVAFKKTDVRPMLARWKNANWDDPVARKSMVDTVASELWDAFGHYTVAGLVRREVPVGSRVAIVPQGDFGLLPLALAREPDKGFALCDLFELSFAPSFAALDRVRSEPELPTIAAIVNPSRDLPFSMIEALLCRTLFQPPERGMYLYGGECTKSAVIASLKSQSHWLFSTHGEFDQTDARRSCLRLSNGERLALDDLLTLTDLRRPRLVILSACQTGVHAVETAADEFVGLAVGFLQLGADAVLATLWPVSDVSTALFVGVFMASHIAGGNRPAIALHDAQRWMRDATAEKIHDLIVHLISEGIPPKTHALLEEFAEMLSGMDLAKRVFEHPYYWGGFVLYGA
jgi:tetratricopeptide (TPR) repeat protein